MRGTHYKRRASERVAKSLSFVARAWGDSPRVAATAVTQQRRQMQIT